MKRLVSLVLLLCLIFSAAVPLIAIADDEKSDEAVSGGDLTRLNVPKTTYEYGEPIIVSAIGTGYDWVGLYKPDGKHSMYYKYIGADQKLVRGALSLPLLKDLAGERVDVDTLKVFFVKELLRSLV